MITLEELNKHGYPTTSEIDANLQTLLEKMNKVREAWGKPMIVTSGLRSESQQRDLLEAGRSTAKTSKHLLGLACDILDEQGDLKDWLQKNLKIAESIGFWFEDFSYTPNWVHFQIVPPGSGKRFFIP